MKIELITNDKHGRKTYQDSPMVMGIVERILEQNKQDFEEALSFIAKSMRKSSRNFCEQIFNRAKGRHKQIGNFELIQDIHSFIMEIYEMEGFVKEYKGAIPERLCYEKTREKYCTDACLCDRECKVKLNSFVSGNVDVFGWDCSIDEGEGYECKFSKNFGGSQINALGKEIKNLNKIRSKFDGRVIPHIFTFDTRNNFKRLLDEEFPDCDFDIIGQEEIFDM